MLPHRAREVKYKIKAVKPAEMSLLEITQPLIFSYGWCGTIQDFSSFTEQKFSVTSDGGWGFCQKSCFPSPEDALGGVERFKQIQIIANDFCYQKIKEASTADKEYTVEPKVLLPVKQIRL